MSRSGYCDYDDDSWGLIRWRGAVASAIRGKRGQRLIDDMQEALDAMLVKELHAEVLQEATGPVCAMGAVARSRGLDLTDVNPELPEVVSERLGIAEALAKEVAYQNDEGGSWREAPAERWMRMREWAWRKSLMPRPCVALANRKALKASEFLCMAADSDFSFQRNSQLCSARLAWGQAFRMAGVRLDGER